MSNSGNWFIKFGPSSRDARLILICVPCAGSGASSYHTWADRFGADIAVWALQLAGRENRLNEAPAEDLPQLVTAIADSFYEDVKVPFVLFGHSLGALISFEFVREARRRRKRLPECLIVAAHRGPHLPDSRPTLHGLPDEEFVAGVAKMGGLSQEVLADAELVELVLPILRADFQLAELYKFAWEEPLDVPVAAFGGSDDDEVDYAELLGWRAHTRIWLGMKMFRGGHFFPRTEQDEVLRTLSGLFSVGRIPHVHLG